MRVDAIEMTEFRVQASTASASGSSQLKIMGTEAQQAIDALAMAALVWQPDAGRRQ